MARAPVANPRIARIPANMFDSFAQIGVIRGSPGEYFTDALGRIKGQKLARAPDAPTLHFGTPPGVAASLHRPTTNGDACTAAQRANQFGLIIWLGT